MLNKPQMTDAVFAVNVRYSGAAILVYTVILMKTAPEILSFGFVVPRQVYGCIFAAILTGILVWYRRQLRKRGIILSKPIGITALVIGGIGIAATIAALIWRDTTTVAAAFTEEVSSSASMMTAGVSYAAVVLSVADWLILVMPVILYIELLIRLRKI